MHPTGARGQRRVRGSKGPGFPPCAICYRLTQLLPHISAIEVTLCPTPRQKLEQNHYKTLI